MQRRACTEHKRSEGSLVHRLRIAVPLFRTLGKTDLPGSTQRLVESQNVILNAVKDLT